MRLLHFPGRLRHWLSLLSAAAVVATTVTAVMVMTVTPAAGATGIPAFYLTINDGALKTAVPRVEVHKSSDGAVTGTLLSPPEWRIQEVSAAAGDRTFFVAESKQGLCPAGRFLEFGVTDSGVITGLRQVGGSASGMIGSLTASPDGTRLAYTTVCGTLANPGPVWVVHVMDLASGAVSSWTSAAKATGFANVAEAGDQALGWTANGRSLSFAYQWKASQAFFQDMAVVLVNPDSGSGTLPAHSRLVWHQGSRCAPGPCVFNAWISPAGTGLLAEAIAGASAPGGFTLDRLSLPAGHFTSVLFRTTPMSTGVGIQEPPAWVDGSGRYWLVYAGTKLGWVRQGQFHPLQSASTTEAAAW